MRVTCPGCRAVYEIPAQAVDRLPARLRCGACGAEWAPEPPSPPSHDTPPASDPHAMKARDDFATGPNVPPKSRPPESAYPADHDQGSGPTRSAEDHAPRIAATALRTPVPEERAGRLPEPAADTVAIPEPPHPERQHPVPRDAVQAAEAEPEPQSPFDAAVKADDATGDNAAPGKAAEAEISPRRPMRAPSADSARAHQGTLSAFEAGDTARTGAARERRGGGGWITSIVILLVIIGLFLALHGLIARVWPPSLRLYQAIGLA